MAERIFISDLLRNTGRALTNRLRLLRRSGMDYVVLRVSGTFPERTVQPRRRFPLSLLPWPTPPPSVQALTEALDRLERDPRLEGVILIISGLAAGPATLGSLRQAIIRFRESGKRAIAYLHDLSMWPYYLACACDEIIAPESVQFRAAGLWSETLFLKDTLALVGLEADFEAIGEYKVTPDMLRRTEMTEPHREMVESLLDSIYDEIVGAIARGRDLPEGNVRDLLDSVPLTAAEAQEAALLDAIRYEDELPAHLGSTDAKASVLSWHQVRRRLVLARRWRSRRAIGVISLEGTIVPGPSRQPPLPLPLPLPVPATQAGSETVIQQLRAAAQDRKLGAIVLHVDSPGGSAFASDLIWREVSQLRQTKPVVVYMGNQAASGGYYVSAPASAIVAQPTTLTGSIGIWGGKIVTRGLFDTVHARRTAIARGKAAGLYADLATFSEEERARIRADIGDGYARFKGRVASGRQKTDDDVEAVARGHVWTGEQALGHGLVDALGDLQAAADRARKLAGIDPRRHAALVNIQPPKHMILAQPVPPDAAGWLTNLQALFREGVFALAPWQIRIRG
jgi:protease-4